MTKLIAVFALLAGLSWAAQENAPAPAAGSTMTLEEVMTLAKAGVSDEIIITKIRKAGRAFDLTAEEILELKRSGISDAVVQSLMDPSKPYTPPPAPPPPAVTAVPAPAEKPAPAVEVPKKPKNPLAAKIPPEPGMYWQASDVPDKFSRLEFKTITSSGSAGKLSKLILRKGTTGYLIGKASKSALPAGPRVFFYRLPEKANVEELVLVALNVKDDRRELEFGPDPAKPAFEAEALKQYSAEEIDTGLYRVTAGTLGSGEYVFFLLGSGEEKKGILGKGYEFGVRSAERKGK